MRVGAGVLEHVDRLDAQCLEQQQQLGYAAAQLAQQADLIDALRRVIAGLEREKDAVASTAAARERDKDFAARRLQRSATFAGNGPAQHAAVAGTGDAAGNGGANGSKRAAGQGMPPPFPGPSNSR